MSANVVELLRQAAEDHASRRALVVRARPGRDETITFAGLWERVDRLGVGLHKSGLAPGQRVILMVPMSIDLYVSLLAVLKAGAVGVFVDPWVGRRQLAQMAAFAEPSAYLGVAKSHLLRVSDRRLWRIPLSITTGRRFLFLPAGRSMSELMRRSSDGIVHPAAPSDSALITFTTGSSGAPKGANRTHGFLAAQHQALKKEFPYRDDDVDLPMFPVFALNNLASGVTSVVPAMDFRRVADVDAAVILDQIRRHDVTTCTASPPFIDRLVERLSATGDLRIRPSLRRVITGGAPVTDGQLESWRRVLGDAEVIVAYGSTEAEPVCHVTDSQRLSARSGVRPLTPGYCTGRPIDDVETRLIRIHSGPVELSRGGWSDWTVAAGEIGELVVRGAHVCRDYFNNPQAVAENKIRDGDAVWHRMGDTGYFDAQGRFWLVGRVHSTIHRGGQTLHPQLIEQAAREQDNRLRHAAALGVPAGSLEQKLILVIQPENDSDENAIKSDLRARLANIGMPCDEIILMHDPLPVDPRHNSKIDYEKLREMLDR